MKFLTIYPACTENEVFKDPFQLPYNLKKRYNIEASFVCWKINDLNVIKQVKGLKIRCIKKFINNEVITILLYVALHAKKIDWLNLYFLNKSRLIIAKVYKMLNPKGHIYVKMDAGGYLIDHLEIFDSLNSTDLKKIDLISCESKCMSRIFSEKLGRPVIYVPNGFSKQYKYENHEKKKLNYFLTIGRLGTMQKNTEGLLEAFAISAKFHDWCLRLIGPIGEDNLYCRKFSTLIEDFFEKYPNLRERVIFTGEIYEREKIKQEYDKAKVLLLPSKWEGSPIVIPEALSSGLHILASTEVMIAEDLKEVGYAKTLPYWSTSAWVEAIIEETKLNWNKVNYQKIIDYANAEYSWESSCDKLYAAMKQIENE